MQLDALVEMLEVVDIARDHHASGTLVARNEYDRGVDHIADHWGKLSRAQQTEFSKLLAALVENSYVRALRSNLDYDVQYRGETVRGADRIVSTEVTAVRNGRPQTVGIEYVLRPNGGTLRAVDVITDGVGIVENYRSQFNRSSRKKASAA